MNVDIRQLLGFAVMAALIATSPFAEATAPERLVPPADAHLSHAWIPDDGPALMAWESTEAGRSGVVLYENGERSREWVFDDLLVKDARWLVPGERLRLGVVLASGEAESRVYSLRDGDLRLLGSTGALTADWESVSLSDDGQRWVAARFDAEAATVGMGKLGDERPTWTWRLTKEEAGASGPGVIEELNRVRLVEGPGGAPVVVLLWNGGLWLADPASSRRTDVQPPGDCESVQTFTAVESGLWVQCFRGLGKEPPGLWGYYPVAIPAGEKRPAARTLAVFRNPWFRGNGTVVDVDRRLGTAEIHALAPDGAPGPSRLGTLELPVRGARYSPAGDALLRAIEGTEQYEVVRLGREIADLRRAAGLKERGAEQ